MKQTKDQLAVRPQLIDAESLDLPVRNQPNCLQMPIIGLLSRRRRNGLFRRFNNGHIELPVAPLDGARCGLQRQKVAQDVQADLAALFRVELSPDTLPARNAAEIRRP